MARIDLGQVGDHWRVVFTRTENGKAITEVQLTLVVEDEIVQQGKKSFPGLILIEDAQAETLSDFEKEWICYCINEGGVSEDTCDLEDPFVILQFKLVTP